MFNYKWSCSHLISSGEDGQCDDNDGDGDGNGDDGGDYNYNPAGVTRTSQKLLGRPPWKQMNNWIKFCWNKQPRINNK